MAGGNKRQTYNAELMEGTKYESVHCLRRLIANLGTLQEMCQKGDGVALSIMVDLKKVLGVYDLADSPLTDKQRKAIVLNLICGFNQYEVAEQMGIGQTTVSNLINGGLRRMSKALTGRKEGGGAGQGFN